MIAATTSSGCGCAPPPTAKTGARSCSESRTTKALSPRIMVLTGSSQVDAKQTRLSPRIQVVYTPPRSPIQAGHTSIIAPEPRRGIPEPAVLLGPRRASESDLHAALTRTVLRMEVGEVSPQVAADCLYALQQETLPFEETACEAMAQAFPPVGTAGFYTTFTSTDPGDWLGNPARLPAFGAVTASHSMPDPTRGPDRIEWVRYAPARRSGSNPARAMAVYEQFVRECVTPRVPIVPPALPSGAGGLTTTVTAGPYSATQVTGFRMVTGYVEHNLRMGQADVIPHGSGTFDFDWASPPEGGFRDLPFAIRAMSDGEVIWKGYDLQRGNHIIVEYPNGGSTYRATYQHIIGDREHDLELASDYVDFCEQPENRLRRPCRGGFVAERMPDFSREVRAAARTNDPRWGAKEHSLRVDVGSTVHRGQVIGFGGQTGLAGYRNIHLHFGIAAPMPAGGEFLVDGPGRDMPPWWHFDPYGIYAQRDCYLGLYPSGRDDPNGSGQHLSIFAPLMPDFTVATARIVDLADAYYRRMGWSASCLVARAWSCIGLTILAGVHQPAAPNTPVRLQQTLDAFQGEAARLAEAGWVPRTLSVSCPPGGAEFSTVWQRAQGQPRVLPRVPANDLDRTIREAAGPVGSVVLHDAAPYLNGDVLVFALSLEMRANAIDGFMYRTHLGLSPNDMNRFARAIGEDGRAIVRVHHYRQGGRALLVAITRRQQAGERFTYQWGMTRDTFSARASELRSTGELVEHFAIVGEGNGERYYAVFRSSFGIVDVGRFEGLNP